MRFLILQISFAATVICESLLSYDLIDSELVKAGVDPMGTVLGRFPLAQAKLFARTEADRLNGCYQAEVGQNIFQNPLRNVIYEYLKSDHTASNLKALRTKIHNLNTNIASLAANILKCLSNSDPNFEPTTLGLTQFSSMSPEETATFYEPLPLYDPQEHLLSSGIQPFKLPFTPDLNITFPDYFDYRDLGFVSPVKYQARCGLCFLFGAISAIESSFMIKYNVTDVVFSEAEALNCLWAHGFYNDSTCRYGGNSGTVLDQLRFDGVTFIEDTSERYTPAIDGGPFHFHPERCAQVPKTAKIIRHYYKQNIHAADVGGSLENFLKAVLLQYGPVTVRYRARWPGHNATNHPFAMLIGKQNSPCNASTEQSHAMTLVGWDERYYIIKNSWGNFKREENGGKRPWGVEGYLYLRKDLAEGCGIFGRHSEFHFPEVV